jgi:hypothetical protein
VPEKIVNEIKGLYAPAGRHVSAMTDRRDMAF